MQEGTGQQESRVCFEAFDERMRQLHVAQGRQHKLHSARVERAALEALAAAEISCSKSERGQWAKVLNKFWS